MDASNASYLAFIIRDSGCSRLVRRDILRVTHPVGSGGVHVSGSGHAGCDGR
jgi:hypothetical protein